MIYHFKVHDGAVDGSPKILTLFDAGFVSNFDILLPTARLTSNFGGPDQIRKTK